MSDDLCWPLKLNIILRGRMGTFGMVRSDGKEKRAHHGWDLYAYPGITCHAVGDGEVFAAWSSPTYGLVMDILLDATINGDKVFARYAHLSGFAANLKKGARVAKGQIVGFTGNSGNARGMMGIHQHLHFEFMKYASPGKGEMGLQQRFNPELIYGPPPLDKPVHDPFLNKPQEPDDGRTMPRREEAKK